MVALLATLAVKQLHGVPLALMVILIGFGSFYSAARMDRERLQKERYMRGPGWWMGFLLSKTSVGFARAFYVVLGLGICALGVVYLVSQI